jgi:hypothetical protein
LTTGQTAAALGVQRRRIIRLFTRGLLAEPPRVAGARLIKRDELPLVAQALSRSRRSDDAA